MTRALVAAVMALCLLSCLPKEEAVRCAAGDGAIYYCPATRTCLPSGGCSGETTDSAPSDKSP